MQLRSIALSMSTVAAATSLASAQLLAYEPFDYGALADLAGSDGGTGWTTPWWDVMNDQPTSVSTTGLAYPGLDAEGGTAVTGTDASSYPLCRYYRAFTPAPAGTSTIYVSFLLRADPNFGSWGGLLFGQYPAGMYVGSPLGMYAYGLMMSEGLGDISNVPLVLGETAFLVVRLTKNVGPSVTFRLYVNAEVGSSEPANPDAEFTIGMAALPTALNIDNNGGFTTDEIRVATTWVDAVPPPPACVGDMNRTRAVDAADLSILLGNWGLPSGDLNDDGTTDAGDLAILLGSWGPCP